MSVMTSIAADGSSLPAVQPLSGSVSGSPFSVTNASAVSTPAVSGMLMLYTTEQIHVRFSREGDDAATTDMPVPPGQIFVFPMDTHVLSMIAASTAATVYTELVREVGG